MRCSCYYFFIFSTKGLLCIRLAPLPPPRCGAACSCRLRPTTRDILYQSSRSLLSTKKQPPHHSLHTTWYTNSVSQMALLPSACASMYLCKCH